MGFFFHNHTNADTLLMCVCVFDIEGLVRETGGLAIKNLAG